MQKLAWGLVSVFLAVAMLLSASPEAEAMQEEATWDNLSLPGSGHALVVDPGRGVAYVSFPELDQVGVFDLATGTLARNISVPGAPRGMHLGSSNDTLYVALNSAGAVAVVDLNLDSTEIIALDEAVIGSTLAWDVFEVDTDRFLATASPGSSDVAWIVLVTRSTEGQIRVASGRIIRAGPTFLGSDGAFVYVGVGFSPNSLYKIDLGDPAMPIVAEDDHGAVSGTQRGQLSVDGTELYLPTQTVSASDIRTIEQRPQSGTPGPTPDGTRVVFASHAGAVVVDVATGEPAGFVQTACDPDRFREFAVVAHDSGFLLLNGTTLCSVSFSDSECAGSTVVATKQELERAIGCFNQQLPAGHHVIGLADSIDHDGLALSQDDPEIWLTFFGNGHALRGPTINGNGDGAIAFESVALEPPSAGFAIDSRGTIDLFDTLVVGTVDVSGANLSMNRSLVVDSGRDGIRISEGNLFVRSSVFAKNSGSGIWIGPGVDAFITDSSIFSNGGSGIEKGWPWGNASTLNVNDSTISSNADDGVSAHHARTIISNSTMFGNGGAGATTATGLLTVTHSTFWRNNPNLVASTTPISVESSVFLNTVAIDGDVFLSDCRGPISATSTSISVGGTCAGDHFDSSYFAFFGSYDDHGCTPAKDTPIGCPFTINLLPGNPALNRGDCTDVLLFVDDDLTPVLDDLASDQRHEPRDVASCDAGAFELNENGFPFELFAPADGAVLECGSVDIGWSGGVNGVYAVHAGASATTVEYANHVVGADRFIRLAGLPSDGSQVFVRLWFQAPGGVWELVDSATYTACLPSELSSPVDGAVLACGSVDIGWSGSNGVFAIHAGSTKAGVEYANEYVGTDRSFVLDGLPANGSQVFVRLWYQAPGAAWELADSATYTACGSAGPLELSSPTNAAVLACGSVDIGWSGGSNGVYAVHAGATAAGVEYANEYVATDRSLVLDGLPSDGSEVFVRLWFQAPGGVWELADSATYTACQSDSPLEISSPVDGAVLECGAVDIEWTGGFTGVYAIHAGSSAISVEYANEYVATNRSFMLDGLPSDGSPVHVRLWFQATGGAWELADSVTYTACGSAMPLELSSPVDGAVLECGAVDIEWTGGFAGVYAIHAGSSAISVEYANEYVATNRSFMLDGLPSDGSPVHVRLWFQATGGAWELADSAMYTACGSNPPLGLTSPADGAVLECGAVDIEWTGGFAGVYAIHAGSSAISVEYANEYVATNRSFMLDGLPSDGSPVYVRLWFLAPHGLWELADSATYTACGSASPLELSSPGDGSVLTCGAVELLWSGGFTGVYAVHAGTSATTVEYANEYVAGDLSFVLDGLPSDGSPVYVRLWYQPPGGVWELADSATYTACVA